MKFGKDSFWKRWKRKIPVETRPMLGSVCVSMVRNEQDIIEPFLRHNARFFDLMFVLDNGSSDRTRDIMFDCARELGNICIADIPHRHYAQGEFMTKALQFLQAGCFADFVAFLDADEFVDAPDRTTLNLALDQIEVNGYGTLKWKTILPDPEGSEGKTPDCLDRMVWQRREEQPEYIKGVLRLGGQVRSDITVDQGNHGFRDAKGQPLPSVALEDIALLHLPVRNSDQIIAKGVLGWKANQARADATAESAYQWKRINDLFESGQTVLDNQILAQEAMAYAQTTETPVWSANALPWQGAIVKNRSYSDGQSAPFDTLLKAGVEIPAMRYQPGDRLVDSDAESHISHAFDDQWHWDHFFLDIPPFQFIAEKYQIKSCLDVGCGTGALLDYLKFMGISDILGADGISRESTILSADEFRREDLEKPLNLGRTFDLVFCLEVVEHVEPAATKTVIDTIARHARDLIVFSMAEPGQPGNQHINCLSMSDVLDIWADKGWVPVIPDTLAIRAISTLSWFRRNLLVLQRADKVAEPVDDQVLRSIGGLAYEWYGQTGGIRRAPFDEALQPVGNGYW